MKGKTVEQSDLIGTIKDFPIEVVQEMVNEQVRQGNNTDVGVFIKNVGASKNNGGFDWCYAISGFDFWDNVIYRKNLNLFFKKYPKDKNKYISKVMKKKEKKTEKKVVVSKEKYDKLVAENESLIAENESWIAENESWIAENEKLEFNNANLEKALCNQKKALTTLSDELLRLKSLIENHNKRLFSRKIKL